MGQVCEELYNPDKYVMLSSKQS